jgi:hypothetical protein
MSLEKNKRLVRQFWEAFSLADTEETFPYLSDDIVLTVSGSTELSGTFRGKDEIRTKVVNPERQVMAELKIVPKELIAEGDTVICLADGRGQAKSGQPYNNHYAFLFRIREGKIREIIEYLDTSLTETALFGKTLS